MAAGRQLWLLLWKDYLIRKRKPITLAGAVWATLVSLCLYIVRINIDNVNYPTCQFAARAMPSAGVLNFLQSFVCNVNNECSPMEEFEEIPSYAKSRFTQLQRQMSSLINNETIMDTAATVPDSLKLLATLSSVADNQSFLNISKNGLRVSDLFRSPTRTRRRLAKHLQLPEAVSQSIMTAEVSFDGIIQGNIDICSEGSLSKMIKVKNIEHLKVLQNKLCALSKNSVQDLVMDLVFQVDIAKYVSMIGDMYFKLSGDERLTRLGEMAVAVLRMMSLNNFMPPELTAILQDAEVDFSYMNLTMIVNFLDLFQSPFGETESFKSAKEIADAAILAIQYLHKFLKNPNVDSAKEVTDFALSDVGKEFKMKTEFQKISQIFNRITDSVKEASSNVTTQIIFNVFSRITAFSLKYLPQNEKHDVLFYSTLLAKLVEGAEKIVNINVYIERLAYEVTLRNPLGVQVLLALPPDIITKGLFALADAERIQIMTAKLDDPSQMFCDQDRLQRFFLISQKEATSLKSQLCSDAWKSYSDDLISSFGIQELKSNINSMASLFVLESLGKDISDKLYSIDKDFEILYNFTKHMQVYEAQEKLTIDWTRAFNVSEDSEILKSFKKETFLGKHMLITVHGALAKEVVRQNPLVEYKISPFLKDVLIIVDAINEQLDVAPRNLQTKAKEVYPKIINIILGTALDEEKIYKTLSTPCKDMFCNGLENASNYWKLPQTSDAEDVVAALCNITLAIEEGLKKESIIGKAMTTIKNTKHSSSEEIKWTRLIKGLNKLYANLHKDYTYLFEYRTFGMDKRMQKNVAAKMMEVKNFWFDLNNLSRIMHISIKLGLRLLDILDHGIFDITDHVWLKLKFGLYSANGPMMIVDDLIQLIGGITKNATRSSVPPSITVTALNNILPNLPYLIKDTVDIIISDNTDLEPIILLLNNVPSWPCSGSLARILRLGERSQLAIESIETIICFDNDFQKEWSDYLSLKSASIYKIHAWNTTQYPENLFLKFSTTYDSLIKDLDTIKEIFESAFEGLTEEHLTLLSALQYAVDSFQNDNEELLRNLFSKVDTVLNAMNTSAIRETVSLNTLWTEYLNCTSASVDEHCRTLGRSVWKYTLMFISTAIGNITEDLHTYFVESIESNATVLQMLGFTKRTGLYILYDRLPDFMAVLVNSYWDLGFLNQVLRASRTHFWDCDEVFQALNPGPESSIDATALARVQPIVCPSLLHWLTMPRGDNVLVDVFTKPQYFFFTMEVTNLTSAYSKFYTTANDLFALWNDLANKSMEKNVKLDTLKETLRGAMDIITSYEIENTQPSYRAFYEINKKQITVLIYLTRVVTIINKLVTSLNSLNISDIVHDASTREVKNVESDLMMLQKIYKRRPSEAVALHFDVITDILWTNNSNGYKITNALNALCKRLENKDNSKDILVEHNRVKVQMCAKKYEPIYDAVQNVLDDDFESARQSLLSIVTVATLGDESENSTDIFWFFHNRKHLVDVLQKSIKYSHDLGIPVYLKYLQNILKHSDVVLSFLSNNDWWKELKDLYRGPKVQNFFKTAEKAFDIAEDILTHLDKIHLVKLLRDVNVNSTDAFCQPNITISDYVADGTGMLSTMQRQMCETNSAMLYEEIPLLHFASQGFDNDLKMSKEVDYDTLYTDLINTETKLKAIQNGPKAPRRPTWITKERLERLREVAVDLLSTNSLIKISFGILSNVVDASILLLNNSQCVLCSQFTSWCKQINLQLYKKQEYDNLLCNVDRMSLGETYNTLRNDFHWDMAIRELISTRNYTKHELNKSLNELLEQIKLHLLEDVNARTSKLSQCLANNVTANAFGNATVFAKVFARTVKLIRAELPHLQEVDGISQLPYFKQLYVNVAHNLNVKDVLATYLVDRSELNEALNDFIKNVNLVQNIENAEVDLLLIKNLQPNDRYLRVKDYSWETICQSYDCYRIVSIVVAHIDIALVDVNLPKLQNKEYWLFKFMSKILNTVEIVMEHASGIFAVASTVDIDGVMAGRLISILDAGMQLLMEDTVESISYSIHGVLKELQPTLRGTRLEFDLNAIAGGLDILHRFKAYLIKQDIRINIAEIFSKSEFIEPALNKIGINNTNFWSIAAPRIHSGYIQIKPLLAAKQGSYHVGNFVCQIEDMSKVLVPGNVDVVTLDDIYGAIVEQFCGIPDELAKQTASVLIQNINFDYILLKLKSLLLEKLFASSNLTQLAGDTVLSQFEQMASLIPTIQDKLSNVSEILSQEPLLSTMRQSASIGDMLTSSQFMTDAGNMVCGKPFYTNINRLYKAVVAQQDLSAEPDPAQLEALPTDFCRSLYKDIIGIEGGKIVWKFVKPLIVGKILYTPPNPAVQRIIEKANSTFAPWVKLTNLVHSFAESFSSVDKLSEHKKGLEALQNILSAPQYRALKKALLGDVDVPKVDVNRIFNEFGDPKEIGSLLTKASDLLYCVNLDRFRAMSDEHQLSLEAARLARINEFSAGLIFLNMTETQTDIPKEIEYKLRMDIENAPTTRRLRNYLWTPGPESSFIEDMRYFRGFVQIQDIIDKSIIELSAVNSEKIQRREASAVQENDWTVYAQQMPYPCYRKDFFQTSLYESQSLMVAFFFSLLFTVSSAVRFIVSDRETGNTMLMSVMGVNLSYHTLSWFICSFVEMVVTVGCMTVVLSVGGILPRTDVSLIFALLFIYGLSVLCFCYMLSKFFRSASSAAVCAGIAHLLSFMPFIIILSLEAVLDSSLKIFVSLSMSSSACYAFLFVARFEAMGTGAGWAQLWDAPDHTSDMNIAIAGIMIAVDAALYVAIGLLLDRFFGIKSECNITYCKASGEKAGVSIVNVTKIYDEGSSTAKLALDNVSMELHKGQITTLLGHNGAGKTTLINILTGMLKLTKGHVVVRSDEGRSARLGVCPQHDVLLEYMTAREHLALYAQLKSGLPLQRVQDEVQSMLRVLCLGAVCDAPVARLSGGTRRRLCVALAFVARPPLVSLDEPTAGVDPAARRDIWSMIMKLRENRTILLTTHNLDEAELLSDQIVIMHKGQIHTTGSPIDIKRTLGSGYKLSVMYPDRKLQPLEADVEDDEVVLEEKTKKLLAVTRSIVKNANLVDINGLEVEINLPFYDVDGVSNNFGELCSALEARESELKYQSYSLDCSSLEQVFFNVCQQSAPAHGGFQYDITLSPESASKSASTSSFRNEYTALVPAEGPVRGSLWQQFAALMYARYTHYLRNRWLVFLLLVLPTAFVVLAMAFSTVRPPADAEVPLRLHPDMYEHATQFVVMDPSIYSPGADPSFARRVMTGIQLNKQSRNWTIDDSPACKCVDAVQYCDTEKDRDWSRPEMMLLKDVGTLNNWLIDSQQAYVQRRYTGFSSVIKDNTTHLVAWYNNKGHHALPAALNALHGAVLRSVAGERAGITVYAHPMKISKEQLNKNTVYQHVADAGISAMLLIAYSLVSAGGAIYLVTARLRQEKHLQLLCGVSPALYWGTALLWDMSIIAANMVITAIVLEAFRFPVFVARNNLPAICILILLYGYACAGVVHVLEKAFAEPSLAAMLLFCGNAFVGLSGITLLLILDIISESDTMEHARWVLHKIFLLSPQFALGDGLLEIAKNTIQAQVLKQFGMDTYRDPLTKNVVGHHFSALLLVGTVLILFNLATEHDGFGRMFARLRSRAAAAEEGDGCEAEEADEAAAEAARVRAGLQPLRLRTIGNINAGFVDTEDAIKKGSIRRPLSGSEDAGACVRLRKQYGRHTALAALTLGIPPGQCTALLGENGAGKSTTFSMLTGQLRPTSGAMYLRGRKAAPGDLRRGLISYCPQTDAIDPFLTVTETLKLYCKLRGITDQEEVCRRALEQFELARYAEVRGGSLSGGNRRKLCAALALAGRAPLVLLDEPTSGMDPASRGCVRGAVRAAARAGRAVLLSTHALDDARQLAARVALLKAGRLRALAPLDRCLERFGAGWMVEARVRRGAARDVWLRVAGAAPHARLHVLHHAALHFLVPTRATVDGKDILSKLSDIFRLMADLQTNCDIEDYTVNHSSLDQMFLTFTERTSVLEPEEETACAQSPGDELDIVTAL